MAKPNTVVASEAEPEQLELTEGSSGTESITAASGSSVETVVADNVADTTQENAAAALQTQIEALKKSEEAARTREARISQERDQALQRASQHAAEVTKFRKEAYQSQSDTINTALAASQSAVESAKRDIKTALNDGDIDAQTEAYERLAEAKANISKLQDGKLEIENRIKEAPKVEEASQQNQNNTPPLVQEWISKHRDYITDGRKNDKLRALHWDAIDDGRPFGSSEYIDFIDTKLGLKQTAQQQEEPVVTQQQRTSIVSAPVSREVPSSSGSQNRGGKTHLTLAQREAAKIAGISEAEYAKNLNKLNEMKANGTYGAQQ